jgi:flagellar motor switch protein FliN/FliY
MADDPPPVSTPQSAGEQPKSDSVGGEVASATVSSSSAPTAQASESTGASAPQAAPAVAPPTAEAVSPTPTDLASLDDHAAIDELLKQANFDDPSAVTTLPPAPDAAPFELPNFQQVIADAQVSSIDLLRDVELNVKIELGRSRMLVEDVLKLGEGSVVELDKLAGDPVDVFVNDRLVARGEVLVLNDNFCVRVNEIVAGVKEESQ